MAYPLTDRLQASSGRCADDAGEVERLLRSALEEARRRWPAVQVPDERFVDHVASRLPQDEGVEAALLGRRLEDSYLAMACASRDPAALKAFDREFSQDLHVAHSRLGNRAPGFDDFVQTLRRKLFVDEPPGILRFDGTGSLRSWLRVTAVRTLLDMTRSKSSTEVATRDEVFEGVPAAEDDPELAYLKVNYRHAFREAFEQAAQQLEPQARNVLRAHFVHGMTIDEIAASHGIHRATAARRLAGAREDLLRDTRRILLARLSLSRDELASVMRLIESRLHVTLQRLFETRGAPGS